MRNNVYISVGTPIKISSDSNNDVNDVEMLNLHEKILAIDVGKGTEDIYLFEPDQNLENGIHVIRPSRANLLRKQLDIQLPRLTNLYFHGTIMGGEPWHIPLYKIAQNSNRKVIMTSKSAKSLRYKLDQVTSRGVIVQDPLPRIDQKGKLFETYDIDFAWIDQFFRGLDINIFETTDIVLIACQEHGYPGPESISVRQFRIQEMYQRYLEINPYLESLMFHQNEIPKFAWRFQANVERTRQYFPESQIFVMDSSPAVILGTMLDPIIPSGVKTIINIGNGHTLAMILNETWEVLAIWEHHTGQFRSDPTELDEYLEKLFETRLNQKFVLEHGGHGYYQRISKIPESAAKQIVAIGPNRSLLQDSRFKNAISWVHPLGSMMLAGPAGLLKTYEARINKGERVV
ncbi:MAG: DUF1786 family protein [Candidatus Heimdallarchaeota archaeon]